jgi:hypothetical protein
VAVHARRVSGAGNVLVYPPLIAELTSRFLVADAATNGTPGVS